MPTRKLAMQYRNPANAGQQRIIRGRQPILIKELLAPCIVRESIKVNT